MGTVNLQKGNNVPQITFQKINTSLEKEHTQEDTFYSLTETEIRASVKLLYLMH